MIYLEPQWHRQNCCISIRGSLDAQILKIIRDLPGRSFSITHRCWYFIYSNDNLNLLIRELSVYSRITIGNFYPVDVGTSVDSPGRNFALPEEFRDTLIRLGYSDATCKSYELWLRQFGEFIYLQDIDAINEETIHRYLLYLIE